MKIKVLKSIIKGNGIEIFEVQEENIPFLEILENDIVDIDFKDYRLPRSFPEAMTRKTSLKIPSFRIKIDKNLKNIKGFILISQKINAINFLEKYYVDGDEILDNYIKKFNSKKEGIWKAFLEEFEKIKIVFPFKVTEDLSKGTKDMVWRNSNFVRYKDLIVKLDGAKEIKGYYREKFIKIKNYKIKRGEYLFRIPEEGRIFPRKRFLRAKISYDEVKKWIYYDGKKFNYFDTLPQEVIERFDEDGKVTYINEEFLGYNFLKFLAFLPWRKNLNDKIDFKKIKNSFNIPLIFAFDSRIPINLPGKIKIIEKEEIIQAFKYLKQTQRNLENFPVVYFHPSIKDDTEFLTLAIFKNG